MAPGQKERLTELLRSLKPTEFHHGDCVGADCEAHNILRSLGTYIIHGHPPSNPSHRAWCRFNAIEPEAPYLTRNKHIVDATGGLIACPNGPERLRSGTWSTVRYAIKRKKPIFVIMPNGDHYIIDSLKNT